jgi:hypothetical protein
VNDDYIPSENALPWYISRMNLFENSVTADETYQTIKAMMAIELCKPCGDRSMAARTLQFSLLPSLKLIDHKANSLSIHAKQVLHTSQTS